MFFSATAGGLLRSLEATTSSTLLRQSPKAPIALPLMTNYKTNTSRLSERDPTHSAACPRYGQQLCTPIAGTLPDDCTLTTITSTWTNCMVLYQPVRWIAKTTHLGMCSRPQQTSSRK